MKNGQNISSDKIFRLTKVTKFSDGDENFVQRKILSDKVSHNVNTTREIRKGLLPNNRKGLLQNNNTTHLCQNSF